MSRTGPGRIPRRSRCILYVNRGVRSLGVVGAGPHAIAFSGRVGRTMLAPGTYRATIVALGANGTLVSNRQSAIFTIVR